MLWTQQSSSIRQHDTRARLHRATAVSFAIEASAVLGRVGAVPGCLLHEGVVLLICAVQMRKASMEP